MSSLIFFISGRNIFYPINCIHAKIRSGTYMGSEVAANQKTVGIRKFQNIFFYCSHKFISRVLSVTKYLLIYHLKAADWL